MHDIRKEDHAFVIIDGEEIVAEVTFASVDEQSIVIDHTFVAEELRGQHVGKELIERVVQMAREEGKKIVPSCPYAEALFKRTPEYHDIWKKDS